MEKKIDVQAFEAFLQKAFKLSAEELASLYNEAGELSDFSLLERKDAERIGKLNIDKENQYKRGQKEASIKIEKAIKEKYDVDSELTGVELIDYIIETKLSEVDNGVKDVMKHPDVIKLINDHTKALKAKDKEWQQKYEAKEAEIVKAQMMGKVKNVALAEFDALNPILSEDPRKAQAQKDIFLREIEKGVFQEQEGQIIPLNDKGENLKDEHGHQISFADYVRRVAETYFDFRQSQERTSAGNQQRGQQGAYKGQVPKNNEEYIQMMREAKTPEERKQIMKSYVKK